MKYSSTGRLFSGTPAYQYFDNKRQSIINEINSKSQNELLNISIEQYSEYLYSIHYVEYPSLNTTDYTISSYEGDISASRFPIEFHILDRNKTIKRDIVVFHVPYEAMFLILIIVLLLSFCREFLLLL
jgi:hypothetical protein